MAAGQDVTVPIVWNQDDCTYSEPVVSPNPDCPQTQVPSGGYTATESWSSGAVTSASFAISP